MRASAGPGAAIAVRNIAVRDDTTDTELITATRAGDLEAYGELYRRHADSCRRLARRLCDGPHTADDVVSEVFVNTLNAIGNGHGPTDAFAPYVIRAVRHQCGRVRGRGDGRHTNAVDPADLEPLADGVGIDQADQLVITQAFGRLPERFRQVLWYSEVEGQSHAEIGAQLGIRSSAVAALARRARNAFCRAYLDVRTGGAGCDRHCRATRSSLASYVRGSVAQRTRRRVEAHLETCHECNVVVGEMQRLDGSLRSVPWLAGGAGVLGVSRWAVVAERTASLTAVAELPKILATCAVGITMVAAHVEPHRTALDPAAVATTTHRTGHEAAPGLADLRAQLSTVAEDRPAVADVPRVEPTPAVTTPVDAHDSDTSDLDGGPSDAATPGIDEPAVGPPEDVPSAALDDQLAHDLSGEVHGEGGGEVDAEDATPGLGHVEPVPEQENGDGLVSLDLGGDQLAQVGVGDGLAGLTVGGEALVTLDLADGLADITVLGEGAAVAATVDGLADVTVLGDGQAAHIVVGDALGVDVGSEDSLLHVDLVGIEVDVDLSDGVGELLGGLLGG